MLNFHPFQRAQTGWIREKFYLEYHENDLNIYTLRCEYLLTLRQVILFFLSFLLSFFLYVSIFWEFGIQ